MKTLLLFIMLFFFGTTKRDNPAPQNSVKGEVLMPVIYNYFCRDNQGLY